MVCFDTPSSRPTSAALRPASNCFNAPIISTSLYFLFVMLPSSSAPSKMRKSYLPVRGFWGAGHEKARQRDLQSKDPNVVRGAKAYGDPTNDNGVTVQFGDPGKGNDAITTHNVRVDPTDPTKLQAEETVTIRPGQSGAAFDATVGHEGTHVADAQDFVATIDIRSGGADQSKNLTKYATELKAYLVSQAILASANEKRNYGNCGFDPCTLGTGITPAQALQNIKRLLALPPKDGGYGVTSAKPGPVLYPNLTTPK